MDTIVNLINAAILACAPLLYGTLGEILTEKSGNLNLGVEGMMYMGALSGLAGIYYCEVIAGPMSGFAYIVLAMVFAFVFGSIGALIYGFSTITLRANQNVVGLTLTIFGTGLANFFGEVIGTSAGGFISVSEHAKEIYNSPAFPDLTAFIEDILPKAGPYLNKLIFGYGWYIYIGIALAIAISVIFKRTKVGLNLCAVGQNPATADAVGINVDLYKYLATVIGGGICGIGGMYISLITCNGVWIYNCVNGKGWIAVALVIFAMWSPALAIIGAIVFGGLSILRMYIPAGLPMELYDLAPYIATVAVLIITSAMGNQEHSMPKHCGQNYFREER